MKKAKAQLTREGIRLIANLAGMERKRVKVGVLAASDPGGEFGIVALAATHEFGAPARSNAATKHTFHGIPERSFIRRTFEEKREEVAKFATDLAVRVVTKGLSITRALEALGKKAAVEVQKTITEGDGVPPPLAASTIERKGSARPLVEDGRLLASITHEVFDK